MIYDNLDQLYEEIKNDRSQLIEIKDQTLLIKVEINRKIKIINLEMEQVRVGMSDIIDYYLMLKLKDIKSKKQNDKVLETQARIMDRIKQLE